MWLFGKRTNIIKAARDDEEDERLDVEELPSFAPEIETGLSEYTEEQIEEDIKELQSQLDKYNELYGPLDTSSEGATEDSESSAAFQENTSTTSVEEL